MTEPEWWDLEAEFWMSKAGVDLEDAKTITVMRWTANGDLRPLAAALMEKRPLDPAIRSLLADMIYEDRLKVPRRRGAPRKPELLARNYAVRLAYEKRSGNSDEAFERIAALIGRGDRVVRRAVTQWRKGDK